MKLTLTLKDDLAERLKKYAGKEPVEKEIERRLLQTIDTGPQDRVVLLYGNARRQLEKQFDTTVDSPEDLVRKVRHLAVFKVGEIEVPLVAGDTAMLSEQARFHGKDPQTYLEEVATQILRELLNRA